jgi:trk system potassium uptake protein TrkA
MYIIIVGCGRLGSNLAKELSDIGHDISIIDHDSGRLSVLGSGFNGHIVKGVEFDNDNLLDAGIDKADAILAVSQDDNINITISLIAKNIYHVSKIVARINDPNREYFYNKLNIDTINPVQLGVEILKSRLTVKSLDIIAALDKDYEIIELTVHKLNEKANSVMEIEAKYHCIISGLLQNGSILLPKKDELLKKGDRIICTINKKDRDKLISSISKEMSI